MNELYHFGMPRRSGRYPYGSGDRPYQGEQKKLTQEERYERSLARKEKAKKAAKAVGNLALKSALTGLTVASKVVFSSAVTSATLVGVAAVGYNFITSPECTSLINHAMTKAGTWFFDNYIRSTVQMADQNLDMYVAIGEQYLAQL